MSTITREFAQDIIKGHGYGVAPSAVEELARIALASLEAEPVAYMHRSGQVVTREECCDDKTFAICCKVETPLFTAPPAPVATEINRRAIADKVYGKCCRIPGATFYNAAEFALDEVEACRAAMHGKAEPVTTAYKLPKLRYLETVKFNADCALQDPESIYTQEFFMSLDEVFGERGNYTEPVQAKAVSILIAEIFRLHGYPAAPQQEVNNG